jgi:hypothetical protein
MKKKSDHYLKIVEWSETDGCYIGTCPGLMLGGVHGKNEAKVYVELCRVVEEWIHIHEREGAPLPKATANKKYSGKFMLRVGQDVHKAIAVAALKAGESLNGFCANLLKRHVSRSS